MLFFCANLEGGKVSEILKQLPSKELEKIEDLFSFFVQKDSLGYVLFGEAKPVCFTGIPLTYREYVLPYKVERPKHFQKNLRLGWEAWNRIKHRFKHPNIIVCEEYQRVSNGRYVQLFFINKKSLKSLLQKYRDDFIEVLGCSFSPENFVIQLEKEKKLRPLIKYDQKLLGILLGFGRESSSAFKEMDLGQEPFIPLSRVGYRPKGCSVTPVCFRGYPESPEVKDLIEQYTKEVLEIDKICNDDRFLLKTLEAFCAN